MTYEYASIRVIFGLGTLGFRFNSGKIESGRNGSVLKRVRFGLSMFGSLRVGFESDRVISGNATIQVSFDYGSVCFRCSGSNQFISFPVLVWVWIRGVWFGSRVSGRFYQVYP